MKKLYIKLDNHSESVQTLLMISFGHTFRFTPEFATSQFAGKVRAIKQQTNLQLLVALKLFAIVWRICAMHAVRMTASRRNSPE